MNMNSTSEKYEPYINRLTLITSSTFVNIYKENSLNSSYHFDNFKDESKGKKNSYENPQKTSILLYLKTLKPQHEKSISKLFFYLLQNFLGELIKLHIKY